MDTLEGEFKNMDNSEPNPLPINLWSTVLNDLNKTLEKSEAELNTDFAVELLQKYDDVICNLHKPNLVEILKAYVRTIIVSNQTDDEKTKKLQHLLQPDIEVIKRLEVNPSVLEHFPHLSMLKMDYVSHDVYQIIQKFIAEDENQLFFRTVERILDKYGKSDLPTLGISITQDVIFGVYYILRKLFNVRTLSRNSSFPFLNSDDQIDNDDLKDLTIINSLVDFYFSMRKKAENKALTFSIDEAKGLNFNGDLPTVLRNVVKFRGAHGGIAMRNVERLIVHVLKHPRFKVNAAELDTQIDLLIGKYFEDAEKFINDPDTRVSAKITLHNVVIRFEPKPKEKETNGATVAKKPSKSSKKFDPSLLAISCEEDNRMKFRTFF